MVGEQPQDREDDDEDEGPAECASVLHVRIL
jgi:hypothetical protein